MLKQNKYFLLLVSFLALVLVGANSCVDQPYFGLCPDGQVVTTPTTPNDNWSFLPDYQPGQSVYQDEEGLDLTPISGFEGTATIGGDVTTGPAIVVGDDQNEETRDPSKANEPLEGYYCCEDPTVQDKYYWPFQRDAQGYICSPGHIYHPDYSEEKCSNPMPAY